VRREILQQFHAAKVDDQFIPPLVLVDAQSKPIGTIKNGDVLVYFDYRTDRAKPLTAAFLDIPYGGQVLAKLTELFSSACV
jgi:2,3-bisphosphoglycerate-independent phosphoglycerate mutase